MKKLMWICAALLCVSLWSCSDENGQDPKVEVVASFEGLLSEPNSSLSLIILASGDLEADLHTPTVRM